MAQLSVILPAYNEADNLESAVSKLINELKPYNYEIIIAEDGSTDGTDKIACILSKKNKQVIHLHHDERLGRGNALKNAFKKASGDIIIYVDVDLATNIKFLEHAISAIENGDDISTGSRYLPDSETQRTFKRFFFSKIYNFLVKFLLKSPVNDHQCGFKAFNRKKVLPLLDEVKDTHWFWDTELLIRASRKGLKVSEFPIKWSESSSTKVNVLKDSKRMGMSILKLWWDLRKT